MELIPQARCLREGSLPFGDQQVKHCSLILSPDTGQGRRFVAHERGDGVGIQAVALASPARRAAAHGRPAGVDLVHCFVVRDEELSESTPILPRAFDAPLAWD